MREQTANKILAETEVGYNMISKKFSQTRKHFWRGLEFISNYTHENDNVLDFGCGNGRLLELLGEIKNIAYFGVDVSGGLIDIAREKYGKVSPSCHSGLDPESSKSHQLVNNLDSRLRGNDNRINFQKINPIQGTIPFESGFFNTIYSIAVFHHFPSKKYREDVARQLYEKTKDGGHVVVTVWNLWQGKYYKNIIKNWAEKLKGQSELDWNDCCISFTDNEGKKFQRFHHAFTKGELKKLFKKAGFKIEICDIIDNRNIIYIGKKFL